MAFPTDLTSAVDNTTDAMAAHLNNLEAKVGINSSAVTTSLDYILKNPSSVNPGHIHNVFNGTVGATTPSTVVGTTIQANTGIVPDANDGAYLGTTTAQFSDLFLAEGGVINWDNGDATITQTGNDIAIVGASLSPESLILPNTSPTVDGSIGFDRTGEDLRIGDGTNSQYIHMGVWVAFTPSYANLTEGAGTNTGWYCVIGKTCFFRVKWVFGAGAAMGTTPTMTLPVAKSANVDGSDIISMNCRILDSGTIWYHGFMDAGGALQVIGGTAGHFDTPVGISATSPMTWATGDTILCNGSYEIA